MSVSQVEDMDVADALSHDVDMILALPSTSRILAAASVMTGLRFAAIARVTEDRWVTCATVDSLNFGLKPGDELILETTLCHEVRGCGRTIVIDDVAADPQYREHHTPRTYGFRSYISVPIIDRRGKFFGTLCGLDPDPKTLNTPSVLGTFQLFAELIAAQLDAYRDNVDQAAKLRDAQLRNTRHATALRAERRLGRLREEFIAILGHDLRNPVAAILAGVRILQRRGAGSETAGSVIEQIGASASRMDALIADLLDLTRAQLGGGIPVELARQAALRDEFEQIVAEVRSTSANDIRCEYDFGPFPCDRTRMGQVLSNLLSNAVKHGRADAPIDVRAVKRDREFVLTVINAGETIPEDIMASLSTPFAKGLVQNDREGLGLGLYIVSEIAKAHGGRLEGRSVEGIIEFSVILPLENTKEQGQSLRAAELP